MPQQINLNIAPYFDDFKAENDYHKVLFKPGYPIQARELNNFQSILQNQIEKFGQHFFKEGAKVIPGNIGYTRNYSGILLNNNFKGIPVSAYSDQLIGTKITGLTSGVTAVVGDILLAEDSERNTLTLYCNYISSNTIDNLGEFFLDGEELSCNVDIVSGLLSNTVITSGSPFASTVSLNAAITGSSFQIQEGIYFVRGRFLPVENETIILDQYNTNPTYRVGLYVDEKIITPDQDESLNDNSQGFNNYAAPGADRLKITLSLFKKSISDLDDNNFVELGAVDNGNLKTNVKKGELGGGVFDYDITDTLARRTFDESGNYYVRPFEMTVMNSLDDNIGNRGIFQPNQYTYGGSIPSNDLAIYKIFPGKAYVKGYEIETTNTTWIDVEKPRTTRLLEDQSFIYNTGLTISLNRNYRSPTIGIGNTYYVSLRDQRVGSDPEALPGNEIGLARIYDYKLESGSYNTSNDNLNQWGVSLYDVQKYTNIVLNQSHTLTIPCFIEGQSSGATGFLRSAVSSGNAVTLYEVSGEFIKNEELSFNGIGNGRIAIAVTETSISDVKSLYGTNNGTTGVSTFSADIIQSTKWNVGIVSITAASGSPSISTVRSTNLYDPSFGVNVNLSGDRNIKIGDLVQYNDTTIASDDPVMARVTYVGTGTDVASSYINIVGVSTVTGISEGVLPSSQYAPIDFKVLTSNLDESSDNSLFTILPRYNVADVDLTDASITIRKTFTVDIVSNEISSATKPVAGSDETFLTFEDARYSLIRSDGTTESLSSSKFEFNATSTEITIRNLGTNDTGATLVATLRKSKIKAKKKIKNRVNSIIVDKSRNQQSGIGLTTTNDGLDYGNGNYPYGTRVQDKIISLNNPDIITIHGIYESADTSAPSAPQVTLTSIDSNSTTTTELIIGELLIGQTSGAVAVCAEKLNSTQITYILKSDYVFREGETVKFQESNVSAIVSTLNTPSFEIGSNYTYNSGQKESFYNYGAIKRKADSETPVKQLKIYFENGYYDSTDDGDVTTVNSYNTFNYDTEIQTIDRIRNTDTFDIRPRTSSDPSIVEGARSPLEFFGREFNGTGNSASNILASNENIITNYTYYLGRIDRIFLSKNGKFQVVYGTPADTPELPNPVDDAIEVSTIILPPYLYSPEQASIRFLEHKRFTMSDIKNLENRIQNLEYYTALSLLEVNTANMFVPDNNGLNRFKSGFFVDNFNSFATQKDGVVNNSIDRQNSICRPRHYTNSVDLIFGPVVNVDPTADLAFAAVEGTNVRKQNDVLTLDYADVEWIKQSFGTRTESVTPFLISFWQGTLELTPASDTWIDTTRLDAKIIDVEGDYAATMDNAVRNMNVDPQTGFAPIIWNAWEINWTGQEIRSGGTRNRTTVSWAGRTRTTTTIRDTMEETIDTGIDSRDGKQLTITEQFRRESVGDREVRRDIIPFMRSRNIEFVTKRVKPLTRMYAFFDGVDVTRYCVPKLLEITMNSGTFQVGETVLGSTLATGLGPSTGTSRPAIRFRVAQSNHREGPYNIPTAAYPENPYTGQILPSNYSSTSNSLNIDTRSLSQEAQGDFFGWVESGMVLVGQTSGAQATITNLRLISDLAAGLIGSYFNPNPNNLNHPRFETGNKTFTLINEDDNDLENASTVAEDGFTAAGTLRTIQENILSIRNAKVDNIDRLEERSAQRTTGMRAVKSDIISQVRWTQPPPPPPRPRPIPRPPRRWRDPLAQSFLVEEDTGVFVTKCDTFFRSVDDMDMPVTFQIRTTENGYPTQKVIPFSEVVLSPGDVSTSVDGSVATTFEFKAPVYLESDGEYAMVLASDSTKYSVFISRVGENDLITQTFISNQPYLGSLFKSQNASTWEPSQWEDLKFTLYRADFLENGSVDFYSPELTEGNKQIPVLMPDSITPIGRKIRVGLGTTVADSGYEIGNTFSQAGTNATANLVGTAGTAVGTLTISNAGIGYTPDSGSYTFSNVTLNTLTGKGRGATGNVSIVGGVGVAASISDGGSGYQVGDVLGISNIGIASVGRNMRLTVAGIGQTTELILDNVQGEFLTGIANTFFYNNSVGIKTELNYGLPAGVGGAVTATSVTVDTDGTHIKVNHLNHGMYATGNIVKISGVESDIKPTKLSIAYPVGSNESISVDSATNFSTFENVGVGTTNVGFLRIGKEIIEYTNVSGNLIGGNIVRGSDKMTYPVGTPVYKYELDGVNLKRINGIHTLGDVTVSEPITLDSYHIKLDMSKTFNVNNDNRGNDVGFPALYLNETKSTGGYNIRATQNMPFEILTPIVQNVTVSETSLTGEVRTITNSSISGNEIPFVDAGFEEINISSPNYFETPRMIASKINEDAHLDNIDGNKSLNMRLSLATTDTRVSPIIDAQRVSTILTSNRVNAVITNYATDKRANAVDTDPTACQYISKEVGLQNSATSIKIFVAAHLNVNCDIRAFYAIGGVSGFKSIFTPFPGYSNLNNRGQIIAKEDSNGESDVLISKSNASAVTPNNLEFKEYTFTADNLPSFRSYQIKIILTSTNQTYVPQMKDLRVIALA